LHAKQVRKSRNIGGKKRTREFYAMPPEDAYAILDAIAEINGSESRLKKWTATEDERRDKEMADEISEAGRERMSPFSFALCGIEAGEEVEFWRSYTEPSGIVATVAEDRKHVVHDGREWSLTALATHLLGKKWTAAGPCYFKNTKGNG